jgi:hypothetical protein
MYHVRNLSNSLAPSHFVTSQAFKDAIDREAEREGKALRYHKRITKKHRKVVYKHSGMGSPLAV